MEIGTKVIVFAPNFIHFVKEGEVVQEGIGFNGIMMSKVKFSQNNEVWFADQYLETLSSKIPEKVLH